MTMASMLSWRNEAGVVTNVVIGFVLLMMKSEMFVVGLRLVMIMIMMMLCCVDSDYYEWRLRFLSILWDGLSIIVRERQCNVQRDVLLYVLSISNQQTYCTFKGLLGIGEDLISRLCQKQYLRISLFLHHQSCNWPIDSWIVTLILI